MKLRFPNLEALREGCIRGLNAVRDEFNADVVDYLIKEIVPQLRPGILIPIWIGLCPTPEDRGHESLGLCGRLRSSDDEHALTIRMMRVLDATLPDAASGGIKSGGVLPNSIWVNAREVCTDDGVTCFRCKAWQERESKSIGAALAVFSKFANAAGAYVVATRGEWRDGTHPRFFSGKCPAWDTEWQCRVVRVTLQSADDALQPSFKAISYVPEKSMVKAAELDISFRYVLPDAESMTADELAKWEQDLADKAEAARTKKNHRQKERNATKQQELKAAKAKTVRSEEEVTLLANAETAVTKHNHRRNERNATKQQEIEAAKAKPEENRSKDDEVMLANAEAAVTNRRQYDSERNTTKQQEIEAIKAKPEENRSKDDEVMLANAEAAVTNRRQYDSERYHTQKSELDAVKAKQEENRSKDDEVMLANVTKKRERNATKQNKRKATKRDELKAVKAKTVRSEEEETLLANAEAARTKTNILQNKRRAAERKEKEKLLQYADEAWKYSPLLAPTVIACLDSEFLSAIRLLETYDSQILNNEVLGTDTTPIAV